MTHCNRDPLDFSSRCSKTVVADFQGGRLTTDGGALLLPEVADLENFCEDYSQMLRDLCKDVRGFRPAEAVVDLPAEGALAFLEHLARLTKL